MGWQSGTFTTVTIEAGLPGSGLFVYDGAPGPGDLFLSIAAVAGTDPFGNSYPAGLNITSIPNLTNVFSVQDGNGNTLASIDTQGNITGATVSGNTDVILQGVSLGDLLSGLLNPNSWTPLTMLNGWVAGGSGNAFPSYRMSDAEPNVVYLCGIARDTSAITSTTFAQLPAGFYNLDTQVQFAAAQNGGSASVTPYVQVNTNGNVVLVNAATVASGEVDYIISGQVFLDAPNNPTSGGGGASKVTHTKTYTATSTFCYQGGDGHEPNLMINTNGNMVQGGDFSNTFNGSAKTWMVFPSATIASDLAGATINSVTLKLHNLHSWYNSGMTVALGWDNTSSFPSTKGTPGIHRDLINYGIGEGATLTKSIGTQFGTAFQSGGATSLVLWNGTNNLNGYGYFAGHTAPALTINYTTG
jgi:hypothetical protein